MFDACSSRWVHRAALQRTKRCKRCPEIAGSEANICLASASIATRRGAGDGVSQKFVSPIENVLESVNICHIPKQPGELLATHVVLYSCKKQGSLDMASRI